MRSLAEAFALLAIACGGGAAPEDAGHEWQATTTTEGDRTVVRTHSGSVWGGPAQMVEEAAIGVEVGEEHYMLGQVVSVAASPDRIYVLDASIPVVRVYDMAGEYVQDIGAAGDGPGEFRQPSGMGIGPDGRIYVRDGSQARITIFGPAGTLADTWPMGGGMMLFGMPLVITDDGTLYSPGRTDTNEGFANLRIGMIPRGPDGPSGDPVDPPDFDFETERFEVTARTAEYVNVAMWPVPYWPEEEWTMSPTGAMVAGVSNDYSFEIHYPGGRVTVVEKDWEPVPLEAEEAAWHIEELTAQIRDMNPDWTWTGPDLPTTKPAYDQLVADQSGRIWVLRAGPGIHNPECSTGPEVDGPPCWIDTPLIDVFDLEGRFLGAVDAPLELDVFDDFFITPYIENDMIISVVEDEWGTIRVKRYRLVLPPVGGA
jgi:hypothetical protein